jgi:hypothetical protein
MIEGYNGPLKNNINYMRWEDLYKYDVIYNN